MIQRCTCVLPRYLPDVRADRIMMVHEVCYIQRIKCQQDGLIGDYRAAIVQRRAAGHSLGIATVPGCPTTWCRTVHGCDMAR
jgi:hypothetical protein